MGLVLDYGSVVNHHQSANVEAGEEFPGGSGDVDFYVRIVAQYANSNALMQYAFMIHTPQRYECTKHFQGDKRDRSWPGNLCAVWRWGLV